MKKVGVRGDGECNVYIPLLHEHEVMSYHVICHMTESFVPCSKLHPLSVQTIVYDSCVMDLNCGVFLLKPDS